MFGSFEKRGEWSLSGGPMVDKAGWSATRSSRGAGPSALLLFERLPVLPIVVEVTGGHDPDDQLLAVQSAGAPAQELLADIRAASIAHHQVDGKRDALGDMG